MHMRITQCCFIKVAVWRFQLPLFASNDEQSQIIQIIFPLSSLSRAFRMF
jgi:hypothetical protein